jgi:division protein CdvB (Snf7/Vps24/ESCRT-III family)
MYNILQPAVDLTNANIETLSRFANSREVTELAKDSASKYLELVQDNMAKVAGSDAFATCLQTTIDNYVRFANDYTKNVYGIVAQGQEFVTRQVEEGNKRFAQVADISGRAAQAGTESVKSAGEDVSEAADQIARARPNRGK